MTATLFGETVPVGTVAAKVAAAAVLADTDFFAPLFGADLRIPGFFAFGIFSIFFPASTGYARFAGLQCRKFCPGGIFTQSTEPRSTVVRHYLRHPLGKR